MRAPATVATALDPVPANGHAFRT
ncbi:hypothetical protein BDI4_1060064 [Burkholderia diffusa]|nr:hypothetical protein BDI4_1060064 [Burkholderia diffusa]